ncbi:mitogen-activated protein kinase kinase kinase 4 isoform X2 [Aethina tumida]|uniref:mitogen-activated protein kinase kinase kinase 4 isoform X2 n=1 Tax=Aethina tumida TaxID=116153 RepID=UPI0021490D1A|nr:mitogen-activated protein kinase kinase kinase 4 isoform X2 [Aethina tumida]
MDIPGLSPESDGLGDLDNIYGKTPPRTKILRKNRERKQKERGAVAVPKVKTPISRRNTVSIMYDELLAKADSNEAEQDTKRTSKRILKLQRGSERDLKLDIASAQAIGALSQNINEQPTTPIPSYQIEGKNQYLSLSCRTVQCQRSQSVKHPRSILGVLKQQQNEEPGDTEQDEECPNSRKEFYDTLSLLIRLGSNSERNPRRGISREETLWQNELKDLIWLELKAFHADRTPMEQDHYLCTARQSVDSILSDIMNFKYDRHSTRRLSTTTIDSGVSEDFCCGCLSMYCMSCFEAQNDALRQVEGLSRRLEEAENLFPSNKAFAELYPLYNSPEFVGRVKAISLWYNMTKHQRLKLAILNKLVSSLDSRRSMWPLFNEEALLENGSPSDSNNSSNSSVNNDYPGSMNPLTAFIFNKKNDDNCYYTPYRRYIENVLKTRALHKSLNFLERLHKYVLYKAMLTLKKPDNDEIFTKTNCESDELELQRYGSHSPEARALNLPSYRSSFIFLAQIPLEVIHAYLMMRLEQKPDNPSPLSMRQLMRELKDGLTIATSERERIIGYVKVAIEGTNESADDYLKKMDVFDNCTLKVFGDYLEYLKKYTLEHAHTSFQKKFLEDEYDFARNLVQYIPKASESMGETFDNILVSILKGIENRFIKRIDDLIETIPTGSVQEKQHILYICRELQTLFNEERENCMKTMAFCRTVMKGGIMEAECIKNLAMTIIQFKCVIPTAIGKVQVIFERISLASFDDNDKASLNSRIREILMQGYRFGFEFYREMTEGAPGMWRERLIKNMVHFANLWMKFVTERCERGRGMRPRWANQGLEFLMTVCEPANTKYLSDTEFEELKRSMDECISHVIGTTAPSSAASSSDILGSPRTSLEHIRVRSRGSSPSPRPTYKSQRSAGRKTSTEQSSPLIDQTDGFHRRDDSGCNSPSVKIKLPLTPMERCREAVENLETEMDSRLRKQELIGKVLDCNTENKSHIRRRYVNFSWQRGIKIGQGRFGKVYTAVNINTGEMMAVKEIPLQHNDMVTIKRVAEEIKNLEGIHHKNLVRYYGVEVHKDEMLLFMEFCAEGTLENLVAATETGLPEVLVRRYTYQLVSGVATLHDHGIVHRDIKTANIFLTDEGNCLKIGDFGCAAKIKFNSTMPGELKGFVGTQAYMAPEVFTKNMTEGHGRAADIWSVGCVVVEMASGQRPWANFDSNYQIMFKVGTGQSPEPPIDMIDEGLDFLALCFKHDPKQRATAHELLAHNFCKVGDDLL